MAEGSGIDTGAVYRLLRTVADNVSAKSDLASLHEAVTGYHASVMGHGILISELDSRVRRVEDHLERDRAG